MLLSARKGCLSAWGIDNYVMQMSADNKKRNGVTTVVQFSALTKKRLLQCMGYVMQMSANKKKRDDVVTVVHFSALTEKRLLECMGHQQICYADVSGQQEKG